jgi:hypothetical protein
MKARGRGRVTVAAEAHGGSVVLEVSDDGPGMSDEVVRRCLEPFYTTKTRGISTGLGLALVHGALRKVGGTVEVLSRLGEGTTFRLTLPAAGDTKPGRSVEPKTACVNISDARLRAFVQAELRTLNIESTSEPWSRGTPASLLVVDKIGDRTPDLAEYLRGDAGRLAIVLEDGPPLPQVVVAGAGRSLTGLRRKLHDILRARTRVLEEVEL